MKTRLARALGAAAFAWLALGAAAPPTAPASAGSRYAEGQVWEYRTRPGEEGSLLKIQKIEAVPAFAEQGPVYHISLIGLHVVAPGGAITELHHAPVTRGVLDASVTRLSSRRPDFPSADDGIAEWRRAKGGVFTIPVAKIAEVVEQSVAGALQGADTAK